MTIRFLTEREDKLVGFIDRYAKEFGVGPALTDMMIVTGLQSKSSMVRMVNKLVDAGVLRKLPYRARAIEIARPILQVKINGVPTNVRAVHYQGPSA